MLNSVLKSEERAVFALRQLYKTYGFLPFRMSKFEEYELYMKNKDFLVSDSVITFNDTNGKLLALKPDVTLSIIKNSEFHKGVKQKLFYNENVYRISGRTHQYKEIMQTGLECIGDLDEFDLTEIILVALESLKLFEVNFGLDVSHMGVVSAVLKQTGGNEEFVSKVMHCIGEKNAHEIPALCDEYGVDKKNGELISKLIGIYGKPDEVIEKLKELNLNEEGQAAVKQLEKIWSVIRVTPNARQLSFDFSIVNDMSYYNGIVFKGYLEGIPESVLSGGQYDKLLAKMGKKGRAIGFAVYLDLLEALREEEEHFDVDVVLLYNDTSDMNELFETVHEYVRQGYSITAQKAIPNKLRYKKVVVF